MILRLSRYALCGFMAATLGCQNPSHQSNKLGERDSFDASLSFASDDPEGLETGRGHLPSLASEMADSRHQAEGQHSSGIPGGSGLTVQRLLERGHDADAHGRPQEARMYYEQALAEDPEQPDAHHRLAILADRAGDYRLAEQHYRQALRGKPNDPDVLNDLGYSYFLQGRPAESERYLSQARQIDPRHPHVSENLSLLYDQAKAERVLLNAMGPRQAQATLAQLFQNAPLEERPEPMTPMPRSIATASEPRLNHTSDETPTSLESLQRKMEEARLKSIAERQRRNSPGREASLSGRTAGLPPLPLNHPPQVPSRLALQAEEIPDGRINEAFRMIDGDGPAERPTGQSFAQRPNAPAVMPPAYEPNRLADTRHLADASHMTEERASAPQWNTPPEPWPAYSPQAMPAETIEQTRHTPPPANYPPTTSARPGLPSAARRAAEIGMAAGPGSIFPPMAEGYDSTQPQQGPAPAPRILPGTDSRVNGAMYSQPGGHGVPTHWHDADSPQDPTGAWGQPPAQWNGPASEPDRNSAPHDYGNDPYDQMRARQNAQFHHDQHALAAQPGLSTNGPPPREAVPSSFDPNRQDWPAYTREEYDTRQRDLPPEGSQPQLSGYGHHGGQTVPQYDPSRQPAPQNYGRRW
jgi:hypothetical protein